MVFRRTEFEKLFVIELFNPVDSRGQFVKCFNFNAFRVNNLTADIREAYYSVSKKNVVRGMHFQLPPDDHAKVVYVSKGSINDVCVDLRKKSKTFKKVFSINLTSNNNLAVFIPKGFAHGFEVLEEDTIVNYLQSTVYSPENDYGILWNSINYKWITKNPLMSERDKSFTTLGKYLQTNNVF